MSFNLALERGSSSFTSAAAKFGADGLATGVYGNASLSALLSTGNSQPISAFTWDVWIKVPLSAGGILVAVGGDAPLGCWLGANGNNAEFSVGATNAAAATSTTALNDNAWHLLSGEWTGGSSGTANLYVDGVKVGTATGSGTATASSGWPGSYVAAGGFGSTSTFDWSTASCLLDEWSFGTVAQYGGSNFTPPSAAYSSSRSGQAALYHFDGDATDSNGGPTNPAWAPPIIGAHYF